MCRPRECEAYDALPETVTVYRGQHDEWEPGLCWSCDKDVATWFALRFKGKDPVVLTAKVPKRRILALKLERNELEIITVEPNILKREPADPARAAAYLEVRKRRQEEASRRKVGARKANERVAQRNIESSLTTESGPS